MAENHKPEMWQVTEQAKWAMSRWLSDDGVTNSEAFTMAQDLLQTLSAAMPNRDCYVSGWQVRTILSAIQILTDQGYHG